MGKAILVIDFINDFIYGKLACERCKAKIGNVRKVLEKAREKGIPVIYVNDAHIKGVDPELKIWGDHAIKGTWGAQVIEELKPEPGDYVIEKRTYSGFFETGLDSLLRSLKVDTIVVTGIVTDICVKHTVADAFFRGYNIIVLEDCVESISEEAHKSALEYMKKIYGAKIMTSEEFIKTL